MRPFAPLLLVSVFACAPLASAHDSGGGGHAIGTTGTTMSTGSDAELMAERHLALYRASRHARENGAASGHAAASSNGERGATAAVIRTSATAALPLAPVRVSASAENQGL